MMGTGIFIQGVTDDTPGGWRGGLALLFGIAVMHFLFGFSTFVRWKALTELAEHAVNIEKG